jgi:hypothetical protein
MDPVSSYGVSPDFVKSSKIKSSGRPGRSESSNDLGHKSKKSSRKRSNSSSKMKTSGRSDNSAVSETSHVQVPSAETSPDTETGAHRVLPVVVKQSEQVHTDMENIDIGLDLEQFPSQYVNTETGNASGTINQESETLIVGSDDEGAEKSAVEESDSLYVTPMRPPLGDVPSFLKRVSVPIGEDLLTLLSARGPSPNCSPDVVEKDENGANQEEDRKSEPPIFPLENESDSIKIVATQDIKSENIDSTSAPGLSLAHQMNSISASEGSKIAAILVSASAVSDIREHSRSVSISNIASNTKCSGCDACRGRVCRPRLSVDFYTSACTLRYFPTAFSMPGISGRRMSRSMSGSSPEMIEKSPLVFWHENFKYAIPYKRTIRLFSSISSAVCPKVGYFCYRHNIFLSFRS